RTPARALPRPADARPRARVLRRSVRTRPAADALPAAVAAARPRARPAGARSCETDARGSRGPRCDRGRRLRQELGALRLALHEQLARNGRGAADAPRRSARRQAPTRRGGEALAGLAREAALGALGVRGRRASAPTDRDPS